MFSSAGPTWRSAVRRTSPPTPSGASSTGVAPLSRIGPAAAIAVGCQGASMRPGSRGTVRKTLPLSCPSETHMSGAYSTERSSTSKYSGSIAAATTPAKLPSAACTARANMTLKLPSGVVCGAPT